jgi:type II secretory pathway pseudopilin PulG
MAGFTILELAITLSIMAVLAVGILVPFVAQVSQRKIADTERILEQAKEALLGYATATGRLPCPATAASNGFESFAAGGTVANGNCALTGTHFIGFLPAATLGFTPIDSQGYAIDGWATSQNRIRYAVANQTVNGSANPFTRSDGMRAATPADLATADLLFVCSSGTGAVATPPACGVGSATLTRNAPAVLWSSGANAGTGGASVHEAQNPHPNGSAATPFGSADRIFVSRTMGDTAGGEFDDVVTWLSVGNLVSRMVLGGQLP